MGMMKIFLFKFSEDLSPFCGATGTGFGLLVTSSLVSEPEWAALFALGGDIYVTHSPIFTFIDLVMTCLFG